MRSHHRTDLERGGTFMRQLVALTVALAFVLAAGILIAQQTAPLSPWAYGFDAPAAAPAANAAPTAGRGQGGGAPGGAGGGAGRGQAAAPDTTQHKLEGSTLSFT